MNIDPDSDGRRYRSPRRSEQAASTRHAIAAAARRLFVEKGWHATKIRDIAELAGVSEATVYATYRSKAGLAIALVDAADELADTTRVIEELAVAADDPAAQIRAMVGFDRRLFESAGDIVRNLAQGRTGSSDLDAAYREGRRRGYEARERAVRNWPSNALRPEVTMTKALDVYSTVCSVQTYDMLRDEFGWTADEIEQWWVAALCRLLLADR